MSNHKNVRVSARVCVGARSLIVVAVCLGGLLPALLLSGFLPRWVLIVLTTLLALPVLRKWSMELLKVRAADRYDNLLSRQYRMLVLR
jgi:hypothetical protein